MASEQPISDLITGTVLFNRMNQKVVTNLSDLTPSEFHILFYLAVCKDDYRRVRDIARFLYFSTSTVSSAAGNLENRGYLQKFDLPNDLKAVGLRLLDAGEEALGEAIRLLMDETEFYWNILGDDVAQRFFDTARILLSSEEIDAPRAEALSERAWYSFISRIHLASYTSWFKSTYSLGLVDARILLLLLETEATLTVLDVCSLLGSTASSTSPSLHYLTRIRKLTSRKRNESNQREILVSLTDEGKQVSQEIYDRFIGFQMKTFGYTREEFEEKVLVDVHSRIARSPFERLFGEHLTRW